MSTHTPGPWAVEMAEVYSVIDAEGGRVALITNLKGRHGMGGRRSGEEAAANTLLIAAAPELLAALQKAVELVDSNVIRVRDSDRAQLIAALTQWNTAIANATWRRV
jgi:hypothetical protein